MRTRLSRVALATTATAAITLAGVAVATPASAVADAAPVSATAEAAQTWVFWARYYDLGQCIDVGDQGLRLGLWSRTSCEVNDVFDSVDLWVLL